MTFSKASHVIKYITSKVFLLYLIKTIVVNTTEYYTSIKIVYGQSESSGTPFALRLGMTTETGAGAGLGQHPYCVSPKPCDLQSWGRAAPVPSWYAVSTTTVICVLSNFKTPPPCWPIPSL